MATKRQGTPKTVWLYLAVAFIAMGISGILPGEPSLAANASFAAGIFFRLLFLFLLVNRSWFGWALALVYEGSILLTVALVNTPADFSDYKPIIMLFMHSLTLALLLTAATRQHVFSSKSEPTTAAMNPAMAPATEPKEEPVDPAEQVREAFERRQAARKHGEQYEEQSQDHDDTEDQDETGQDEEPRSETTHRQAPQT